MITSSATYSSVQSTHSLRSSNGLSAGSEHASRNDSTKSLSSTTPHVSTHGSTINRRESSSEVNHVAAGASVTNQSSDAKKQAEIDAIANELANRDREVRAHEQAHAAIGGSYTSAPAYSYEKGPDGQLYAVDGEVRIDTSPVAGDPQSTLEKASVILRASLGVAEPSAQDRQVASDARAMAAEARAELISTEAADEQSTEQGIRQAGEDDSVSAAKAESDAEEAEKEKEEALKEQKANNFQTLQDDLNESRQAVADQMADFNERMNNIHTVMKNVNAMLVDSGVYSKLFPEGSVIDKNA